MNSIELNVMHAKARLRVSIEANAEYQKKLMRDNARALLRHRRIMHIHELVESDRMFAKYLLDSVYGKLATEQSWPQYKRLKVRGVAV